MTKNKLNKTEFVKCPHCDVSTICTDDYDGNFESVIIHFKNEHPEILQKVLRGLKHDN